MTPAPAVFAIEYHPLFMARTSKTGAKHAARCGSSTGFTAEERTCFFQPAQKFKARYATLGFSDKANLDERRFDGDHVVA